MKSAINDRQSRTFVSQIRCQLLFGRLSNGLPPDLSEHAHRQPGRTAEQHRAMLRAQEALRDHDAIFRQRVPDRVLAVAGHGRREVRLLIVQPRSWQNEGDLDNAESRPHDVLPPGQAPLSSRSSPIVIAASSAIPHPID